MRTTLMGLVGALLAIAIATAIKLLVGNWLAEDPNALYLAAVALTAWRFGIRGGISAVILAGLAQAFFFLTPRFTLFVGSPEDLFGLICWSSEGALVCWLIQARHRANADREDFERRVFYTNPVAMYVFDEKTFVIKAANEAAISLYGYPREELLKKHVADLHLPHEREALHSSPTQAALQGKLHHTTKAGVHLEVEAFACSVLFEGTRGTLVTLVDRTAEHKLEHQLRQAQKMDAIGQLAGGIAHDFNNMLTVMLGYSSSSLEEIDANDPQYEAFAQIKHAAERSAELTHKLLTFGRRQPSVAKRVDLNDVVRDAEKLLRRLVGSNIAFSTELDARPLQALVDAGQIEQVIVNLVVNARDAIQKSRGRIRVASRVVEVDAEFTAAHVGFSVGRYVILEVSDDGGGMDAATQSHIFEPFFTTKEQGKGTGLGLAIAFGIVEQNAGRIEVESEVGVGTKMRLYFPTATQSEETFVTPTDPMPLSVGTETILVVDDDAQVLKLVTRLLQRSGYRVLSANHPTQALAFGADRSQTIDLLIADVIMPDMTGVEVATALRKLRPDLKVIYSSGYTGDVTIEASPGTFLQKPVAPSMLRETVRAVIQGMR